MDILKSISDNLYTNKIDHSLTPHNVLVDVGLGCMTIDQQGYWRLCNSNTLYNPGRKKVIYCLSVICDVDDIIQKILKQNEKVQI